MPGVSPAAGWSVNYGYNGQDQVASVVHPPLDANAPRLTYTYNRLGQLAAVGNQVDPGGVIDPNDPPPDPAMRYASYAYGRFDQIATARYNNAAVPAEQGPPLQRTFTYDLALRLTGIADPYFAETLRYVGSGVDTSYYNGQIAAADSTYVPSGSWQQPPTGFAQQFTYDSYGRLIAATNTLGNAVSLLVPPNGYDANGNIVAFQRGATTVKYSYQGTGNAAKNQVKNVAQAVANSVNFTTLSPGATGAEGWRWGSNNGGPSGSGVVSATPPGGQALALTGGGLGHYEVLQLETYLAPEATCTLSWSAATGAGYGQTIGAAAWYVLLYAESGPSVALPLQTLAASASFQQGSIAINLPQLVRDNGGGLAIVAASLELRNLGRNANGSSGPPVYVASVAISGTATGQAYTYDGDGNVIAAPDRNLSQLSYDPATGLTTQIVITGTPAQTVTYAYGADNLRTRATLMTGSPAQTLASTITLTGPDGALLATRTSAGGNTSIQYYVNGSQGPFGVIDGGDLRLLLTDHLGSTRVAVAAASGQPLEFADYLPFGGGQRRRGTPVSEIGFTGQRRDPAEGLYNYNARLYDPALGRFYATDPQGQYASPYAYVGNDPVNMVDPTGELAVSSGVALSAAIVSYSHWNEFNAPQLAILALGSGAGVQLGATVTVGLSGINAYTDRRGSQFASIAAGIFSSALGSAISGFASAGTYHGLTEWNREESTASSVTSAALYGGLAELPNSAVYGGAAYLPAATISHLYGQYFVKYRLLSYTDFSRLEHAEKLAFLDTLPPAAIEHIRLDSQRYWNKVKNLLRPGGMHEWIEVGMFATARKYGLTSEQIARFTTPTKVKSMFYYVDPTGTKTNILWKHAYNLAHRFNTLLLFTSTGVAVYLVRLHRNRLIAPGAEPRGPLFTWRDLFSLPWR